MVKQVEGLYWEALTLSEEERKKFIRLLTKISNEVTDSAEIDDAWLDEAQRRVARYDAGMAKARDANDVLADIQRQLD